MKDIVGYEGLYAITSCGKVWSYKNKRFLNPYKTKQGYYTVNLYKDKKYNTKRIHTLVAEAYIPNPDNLETVDHIDGDKDHNYIGNLQWMTREDNVRKASSKKVKNLDTGEIFNSITEAANSINVSREAVGKVLRRGYGTSGGYHWGWIV